MSLSTLLATKGLLNADNNVQSLLIVLTVLTVSALLAQALVKSASKAGYWKGSNALANFSKFFYASFLKPHSADSGQSGQQAALESFYKAQVCAYAL